MTQRKTMLEVTVFAVKRNRPPCSMSGLAAHAEVAVPEMAGMLDAARAEGLVEHTHLGWDLTERGESWMPPQPVAWRGEEDDDA